MLLPGMHVGPKRRGQRVSNVEEHVQVAGLERFTKELLPRGRGGLPPVAEIRRNLRRQLRSDMRSVFCAEPSKKLCAVVEQGQSLWIGGHGSPPP